MPDPLPLSPYAVLDLTIARAGPTAVRLLADWGANVIKIEPPPSRDETGRALTGARHGPDEQNLHRDKRGLGIEYETLAQVNPRIILASISGFGQSGPYGHRPGVDQIIQGMSRLM